MRRGHELKKVEEIYNNASRHYDLLHSIITMNSDSRCRRMLVERSVKRGDFVLDAGAEGKVVLLDLSSCM